MWPIWFNHQGRHVSAFMDLAKHNVQSLGLATPGGARQIRRAGQWPRNTRYQADATPYLDRTFTGWFAPACGWRTYSITWSASNCMGIGISMPSVLAVLRLITSLNLVGCSTGRWAGLAPFSILSTNVAAHRNRAEISAP